jgi:hypothetical protein
MKTADRGNQTAGPPWPAPESVVRQLKTDLTQSGGLGSKKKLRPREMCFFLTSPFIELIRLLEILRGREERLDPEATIEELIEFCDIAMADLKVSPLRQIREDAAHRK